MKKHQITSKVFSLSCENDKGVLPRIIGIFNRPGYDVITLSQSRTDVDEIILVSIEVAIPAAKLDHIVLQLNRIVGVLDVTFTIGGVLQSAIYRIDFKTEMALIGDCLGRYQARPLMIHNEQLLIHQIGNETEIQNLYKELDGPQLIGFSQQPLPISQPLSWEEVQQLSRF